MPSTPLQRMRRKHLKRYLENSERILDQQSAELKRRPRTQLELLRTYYKAILLGCSLSPTILEFLRLIWLRRRGDNSSGQTET